MTTFDLPERSQPPSAVLRHHLGRAGSEAAARLRRIGSAQTLARATWATALLGTAIVALLALRVWLQLMGDTGEAGIVGLGYDAAGFFAGPFRSFEPSTPIKDSGILEFSTLVAIEAYLIATMITLSALFSARLALFAAPRVVHHRRSAVVKEPLTAVPETQS
jgi:hypothetical protein